MRPNTIVSSSHKKKAIGSMASTIIDKKALPVVQEVNKVTPSKKLQRPKRKMAKHVSPVKGESKLVVIRVRGGIDLFFSTEEIFLNDIRKEVNSGSLWAQAHQLKMVASMCADPPSNIAKRHPSTNPNDEGGGYPVSAIVRICDSDEEINPCSDVNRERRHEVAQNIVIVSMETNVLWSSISVNQLLANLSVFLLLHPETKQDFKEKSSGWRQF